MSEQVLFVCPQDDCDFTTESRDALKHHFANTHDDTGWEMWL